MNKGEQNQTDHKFTNDLIRETSPYLLQHAHNPVNWVAWTDEAFERAAREDKLVLVSIGYSSCHWCHVMEHESFEDEEVATWMNRYFICIKVDREERPDVDQVYMSAVQLMTQRGGWPLNCFALPDGKPVYGGTYFRREHWIQVLRSLHQTWQEKRDEVLKYASDLSEGVQQSESIVEASETLNFEAHKLDELVLRWKAQFDQREGGSSRAPKFMLPNNYEFLWHYAWWSEDEFIQQHVELTLQKMAFGGIYDHLGGGFCRYSTDVLWKVPHFEKMLYDNAQLLSLYAKAYQLKPDPEYARVIQGMVTWLDREMAAPEGGYYSALDADSEGEEGKFYTWTEEELQQILGDDFDLVQAWYEVNQLGYWEEEQRYILLRRRTLAQLAKTFDLQPDVMESKIEVLNARLLSERNKRIKPGLDDKCLTAWNALLITGLLDARSALNDETLLYRALKIARWIKTNQQKEDGGLWHTQTKGRSHIDGFLDDYATVIAAWINLYQHTFDVVWLEEADAWMHYALEHFYDPQSGMFYFTSADTKLIARKMEINDNVIPSTNSIMCRNLQSLGALLYNSDYRQKAQIMLSNVYEGMEQYGSGYSNWAQALISELGSVMQVQLTGPDAMENANILRQYYLPAAVISGGKMPNLPALKTKDFSLNTWGYCKNESCSLPIMDGKMFLKEIQKQLKRG